MCIVIEGFLYEIKLDIGVLLERHDLVGDCVPFLLENLKYNVFVVFTTGTIYYLLLPITNVLFLLSQYGVY